MIPIFLGWSLEDIALHYVIVVVYTPNPRAQLAYFARGLHRKAY